MYEFHESQHLLFLVYCLRKTAASTCKDMANMDDLRICFSCLRSWLFGSWVNGVVELFFFCFVLLLLFACEDGLLDKNVQKLTW